MRITGSGTGGFGSGPGSGGDRGKSFRRRHRTGERLSGRIMRHEAPGLAWVDFQGIELLASIQSAPEPGSVLLFQVIRLEPDILLQELHVARAAGDPLGPAADSFWAARSAFEAQSSKLRIALAEKKGEAALREAAFTKGLEADADLAAAFVAVDEARTLVSALTMARGAGRLEYRPWLLPQALSVEILVRVKPRPGNDPLTETAFSFFLPGAGQCELRLLQSPPKASARLFAEHPDAAGDLAELAAASIIPGGGVQFFAPSPLPPTSYAGILAPLLASGPDSRSRFSRQV